MKGYIKLSRSFFDNEIWQAARAFSECEAWLDLIQSARFEASPTTSRIGVYEVTWGRGQYPASNRFLAKKWGRSEQWVKTFLGKLKRKGMITTENSSGINIITLLNFEKYNASDDVEKTPDNPPGNPPSNPLNELSHSDLQRLVTHLVTQCATHLAENGVKQQPTSNPNKKKEEESSSSMTTATEDFNPKKETSPDGEAKKNGLSLAETADKDKIDWQALMDYYNTTFQGKLPGIKAMTDARKKAVRARAAQYGKEAVMQVFANVLDSPFLLGDNDRNWTADFDWIFKPANFTKILEHRYNGKRTDTNQARRESRRNLASLAAEILAAEATDDGF